MKQKLLSQLAVALPVAAISAASLPNVANAAIFNDGDALSFGVVANIQDLVFADTPTIAPFFDFQPPPNAPGGNNPADTNIAGLGNISQDPTGFSSCNTGSLNSGTCNGTIRDFTAIQPGNDAGIAGTGGANSFLSITNPGPVGPATSTWNFSLLTSTIENPNDDTASVFTPIPEVLPSGFVCGPGSLAVGCSLSLDFTAEGKVFDTATEELAYVTYFYAVTGITIDTVTSTPDGDIFTTSTFAQAGNLRVEVKNVPEPGTVSSLLAMGMVASFGFLRQKSRK